MNKMIARVVERTLPNKGKSLTGSTSDHNVEIAIANAGNSAQLFPRYISNTFAEGSALRKVELVRGTVDRVNVYSSHNVESGLFEAKAEPADPGE
jgi:hypothetical protein